MNHVLAVNERTRQEGTLWRVWSIEHDGWWRPNHQGYTKSKKEAGLYNYTEALQIVRNANQYVDDDRQIKEAMVKADDVVEGLPISNIKSEAVTPTP